jgi:DNA-binding MarR family transcriptional regulator
VQADDDRDLAEFRYQIRRFLRASERAARACGLEPQQHQLLLAIRGFPDGQQATVGTLARRLLLAHHSVVELIDRLQARGLVRRQRSARDRRVVIVSLTTRGRRLLRRLSLQHRRLLEEAGPELVRALQQVLARSRRQRQAKRSAHVAARSDRGSA